MNDFFGGSLAAMSFLASSFKFNPTKPEYRNMCPKNFSIHIYVKIALTKKKKKNFFLKFYLLRNYFFVTYMSHTVLKGV